MLSRSGLAALALTIFLLASCGEGEKSDATASMDEANSSDDPAPHAHTNVPGFVGAASCQECHQDEHADWTGSHHDLAMQEVSAESVLGDFNNASFTHFGQETKFSRDGDRYLVTTDGPGGAMQTYEVAYVFGVYPLQQYLIAFPGGRLQALQVCWDSRPTDEGGQKWYHLYADEPIPHTDVLHWTKEHFNWNYMCADCHSTNLAKNFDAELGAYNTTWGELNVSCEACHGPGEDHVTWAKEVEGQATPDAGYARGSIGLTKHLKEPTDGSWGLDPETLQPKRTPALESNIQAESCAPCHSHRRLIAHPWKHDNAELHQTHAPTILEQALYHDDGQIKEEVYVYGSFVQSKMFHHGVRCSDCHDPHTLKIKAPGNQLCIQCHSGKAYDSPAHHFHPEGSTGTSCVDCHMPGKYYMGVDWRRDHSFRVPRPDLAEKLGTPDSCTGCHTDRDVSWAADAFREWYGDRIDDISVHPGLELAETRSAPGTPSSDALLAKLAADQTNVPGIIRATAIGDLGNRLTPSHLPAIRKSLTDPDPIVRRAAVETLSAIPPQERIPLLVPILKDPVRAVRVEAARLLAPVRGRLIGASVDLFDRAKTELFESLDAVSDRAGGPMGKAIFLSNLGDTAGAEAAYKLAIKTEPLQLPSRINLSELYQQTGRAGDAQVLLEQALVLEPNNAIVQETVGRFYVRQKNYDKAMVHLGKAAQLAPTDPRMQYFYGVALNSQGRADEAFPVLIKAHDLAPQNPKYLMGIITVARDHARWNLVATYGRRLLALQPNPQIQALVERAESQL